MCLQSAEKERRHIRPEGASLLERLLPGTPSSRLPPPPSSNHRGGPKDKPGGPPRYLVRDSCSSNYAVIQCGAPPAKKQNKTHSHINSLHDPLEVQRVRSFTSPERPSAIQRRRRWRGGRPFLQCRVECRPSPPCPPPPQLNGNLVGINST